MKVKVSRHIQLGVHTYRIEFNPLLWHEEGLKGSVNHLKQVIQIDPNLATSQRMTTLLHEINHIVNDNYNCKLDDAEIDRMAQGFAEFLVNNLGIEFDWSDITDA